MNQLNPAPAPPPPPSFTRDETDAQNPYLGLHPFEEKDAPYFFGRVQETSDLFRMVKRGTLTVLFGRSGLGKSSLLRAGLFPRLRAEGFFPIPIRFDYESGESLADQLWTTIDAETAPRRDDGTGLAIGELVWSWFHRVPLWSERNRLLVPALVFDQFEETFTLGKGHREGAAMIAQLADLIENRVPAQIHAADLPAGYGTPKLKVILALREDYLPQLEDLRPLIPSLAGNRYRLMGMNGLQALDAVASPGEKIIDRAVAEKVVRFVATAGEGREADAADVSALEVEPALLSLVCHELNDRRKLKGQPTISEALLSGERSRIIEGFYERSVGDLNREVRIFVEDRLLTSDGYRTTVALSAAREVPNVNDQSIETLIRRRVLRKEDRFGRPHIELIHDVLTRIVRASRDRRRDEERREQLLERRRMLARRGGLAALLLIGLVVVGILVLRRNAARNAEKLTKQKQSLEVAQTLEEAGRKALLRGEGPNAAQLLNLGYRFLRDAGAKSRDHEMMLARALMELRGQVALVEQPPEVGALAYAPGGTFLATGGADGTIRQWDGTAYAPLGKTLRPTVAAADVYASSGKRDTPAADTRGARVEGMEFLDGRRLATLSNGTVTIWDLSSGSEVARLAPEPPDEPLTSRARFCAMGDHLAVWYPGDDRVSTWLLSQVPAWTQPTTVAVAHVADVACLRDGRLLLAGSDAVARIEHDDASPGPNAVPHFVTEASLPHGAPIVRVGAVPNGELVATSGSDGRAVIWRREAYTFQRQVLGQPGVVDSFAFNEAGDSLLIVSGERRSHQAVAQQEVSSKGTRRNEPAAMSATLWDLTAGRPVFSSGGDHLMARFTPGGKTAVVVAPDRLEVWTRRPAGWVEAREITLDGSEVTGVALRDDRAAVASAGGVVRIWELATPAPIGDVALAWSSPGGTPMPVSELDKVVRTFAVSFAVDDEHLVFLGEGRIDFVDAVTGAVDSRHSPDEYLQTFAFDPARRYFVTVGSLGTMLLWDAQQRRIIKTITEQGRIIRATFAPDGDVLVTADAAGRVCSWGVALGKRLACKDLFPGAQVSALAAAKGGATILAGDDLGRAALLQLPQGTVRVLDGHTSVVWGAGFSPDGLTAVTSSDDGTACVWNVATTQRTATLDAPGWFVQLDGKRIVVGGGGKLGVWRADGKPLYSIPALHLRSLSLDGDTLYTFEQGLTYDTGLVRSWNLDDGSPLDSVAVSDGNGDLSPSGKLIATAGFHPDLYAAPSAARDRAPAHLAGVLHAAATQEGGAVTVDERGAALLWSRWTERAPRRLATDVPDGAPPVFSSDGHWLAVADGDSAYTVAAGGQQRVRFASGVRIASLAWAGDRALAVDQSLVVSLAKPGQAAADRVVPTSRRGPGSHATLDANAERFAFVNAAGAIEVWTRDARLFTIPQAGTVKELVLGDAASGLLVARLSDRLLVWHLPNDAGVDAGEPGEKYVGNYGAVYPAGNSIVGVLRGEVQVYTPPRTHQGQHGERPDHADAPPQSEDAKPIRASRPEIVKIQTTARIFPPDVRGRFLLGYEAEEVTIWDLDDGHVLETLKTGRIDNAYFSPNGDVTTYAGDGDAPKSGRVVNWRRSGTSWQRDDKEYPSGMGILYALSGNKKLLGPDDLDDRWPIRTVQRDHRVGLILAGSAATWFLIFDTGSDSPAQFIQASGIVDFRFGDGNHVWSIDPAGTLSDWGAGAGTVHTRRFPSRVLTSGAGAKEARVVLTAGGELAASAVGGIDVLTIPLDGQPPPAPLTQSVDEPVTVAALSPDASRLVIGGEDGGVLLWDLAGGPTETAKPLEAHHARVTAVAFGGPDGEFATASTDGTARIWHKDGKLKVTLSGHLGSVTSVAFDPEGHWIATSSDDGTARIWTEEGMPLVRLTSGRGAAPVRDARFVPPGKAGGKRIITADGDGLVQVWDLGWAVRVWKGDQALEVSPDEIDDYLQDVLPSGHQE